MRKIILAAIALLAITASYSKDKGDVVDLKDDTVLVNGKAEFILEKFKPSPGIFNYFIKDLNGKKLAFLKFNQYNDPKEVSSSNPKGDVNYYEIIFLESNQKAEFPFYPRHIKVAEFLVKQKLVQHGGITADAEQEFILVNGNTYTQKRQEMGGSNTIIINNNNQPTPRNGININVGN